MLLNIQAYSTCIKGQIPLWNSSKIHVTFTPSISLVRLCTRHKRESGPIPIPVQGANKNGDSHETTWENLLLWQRYVPFLFMQKKQRYFIINADKCKRPVFDLTANFLQKDINIEENIGMFACISCYTCKFLQHCTQYLPLKHL